MASLCSCKWEKMLIIWGPGTSQALPWTQASRSSLESGALILRPCLQAHEYSSSLVHTGMVVLPALIFSCQILQSLRLKAMSGAKNITHWYFGGRVVIIQQGNNVCTRSPSPKVNLMGLNDVRTKYSKTRRDTTPNIVFSGQHFAFGIMQCYDYLLYSSTSFINKGQNRLDIIE